MKPTIFELIRPVFEEWIGNIPLVPSAIYGVRIYTEGSILQVRPCSTRLLCLLYPMTDSMVPARESSA